MIYRFTTPIFSREFNDITSGSNPGCGESFLHLRGLITMLSDDDRYKSMALKRKHLYFFTRLILQLRQIFPLKLDWRWTLWLWDPVTGEDTCTLSDGSLFPRSVSNIDDITSAGLSP